MVPTKTTYDAWAAMPAGRQKQEFFLKHQSTMRAEIRAEEAHFRQLATEARTKRAEAAFAKSHAAMREKYGFESLADMDKPPDLPVEDDDDPE